MKLTTLGTSCMFPTKKRSQPAMLLFHEGVNLLFDAGEGVQRQLRLAGISPMSINHVFITHWHGDHSLGVAGLINCFSGNRRTEDLHIYGPRGTSERVKHLVSAFDFKKTFRIRVHEVKGGEAARIKDLTVSALRVRHGGHCLAYRVKEDDKRRINLDYTKKFGLTQHPLLGKLQRGEDIEYKGKKITVEKGTYLKPGRVFCYVTDTSYFPELVSFCDRADLLLCESTYLSSDEARTGDRQHLTAEQAGMLARDAGVKKLVLTHFSQKYINSKPFVKEAGKFFDNVVAAKDFMTIEF
ncbi:ribonuclease Z [archaeon]|nr:ribonuclease Z [archaeon]